MVYTSIVTRTCVKSSIIFIIHDLNATQSSQTVHEHVTQPFSLLTVVRVYDVRGSEEDIKVIHFNHTSRYRFCGVFNKEPFLHDEHIYNCTYIYCK